MKKIALLIIIMLSCVMNLSANRAIYLLPGVWKQGVTNEAFIVCAYNSSDELTQAPLSVMTNTYVYEASVPDNTVKIVFVRYNSSTYTGDPYADGVKWNQTGDVAISTGTTPLFYQISDWSAYYEIYTGLSGFGDWSSYTYLTLGDDFEFTGVLDLSETSTDQDFKIRLRDDWVGNSVSDKEKWTADVPSGWIEGDDNITLKHSTTGYRKYNISLKWTPSADWWTGWTLKITGAVPKTVNVSVGAKGYATYCNADYALDFTGKSIAAYTISSSDGSTLTLSQKYEVAKGEPVLLYSSSSNDSQDIPTIDAAVATAGNKLVQGTGAALTWAVGSEYYVLATATVEPGFYKANNNTVATDKAYLDLRGLAAAPSFTLDLDEGNTTGIANISSEKEAMNGAFYNLAGQKVAQPTKGLYIMNGKKVIIK